MLCYRDRTYCNTKVNDCANTDCSVHLKTKIGTYSTEFNKDKLLVLMMDFSENCDDFEVASTR